MVVEVEVGSVEVGFLVLVGLVFVLPVLLGWAESRGSMLGAGMDDARGTEKFEAGDVGLFVGVPNTGVRGEKLGCEKLSLRLISLTGDWDRKRLGWGADGSDGVLALGLAGLLRGVSKLVRYAVMPSSNRLMRRRKVALEVSQSGG